MIEKPVKSLVVADIHFGFEAELEERGICIPSQVWRLRDLLLNVVEEVDVERVIFLGDLKHLVPLSSRIEWREMPEVVRDLKKRGLDLILVPGNHDGDIELILGELVKYASLKGLLLECERRIFLIHGHAWPGPEALNADIIIMGHLHPVISLRTDVGSVVRRKVWLHLTGDRGVLSEKLGVEAKRRGQINLLVMPAFNPILSGISVNSMLPKDRLWPLIRSGAFNLDSAEAITLGGENLGDVRTLRTLLMGGD